MQIMNLHRHLPQLFSEPNQIHLILLFHFKRNLKFTMALPLHCNLNIMLKLCSLFSKCPYSILGVSPNASPEQLKIAYYTLAKKYHPDQGIEQSDKFIQLKQAYQKVVKQTKPNIKNQHKYKQNVKRQFYYSHKFYSYDFYNKSIKQNQPRWESHYKYRDNGRNYQYFQKNFNFTENFQKRRNINDLHAEGTKKLVGGFLFFILFFGGMELLIRNLRHPSYAIVDNKNRTITYIQ